MAVIVPFPLSRRRQLVARCAARMIELDAAAAEKHLQRQVERQREAMHRRSIDQRQIGAQERSFEAAVRAELWRAMLAPGGAA
jgi:hypothetical protein